MSQLGGSFNFYQQGGTFTFTFNREALLLDELNGSIEERWAVVNIEAHELAHQWTGNLVTLKWSD